MIAGNIKEWSARRGGIPAHSETAGDCRDGRGL